MVTSYIGADIDCKMTELAIEQKQRIVARHRVQTNIKDIKQVLHEISGKKILVFEEGALASWLYRNLIDAVDEIAEIAEKVNEMTENIGARRLHTIIEKVMEDISFQAPDIRKKNITIDRKYVQKRLKDIVKDEDLSRFIL